MIEGSDWSASVAVMTTPANAAADIAEVTGARTLDALHLAAAQRAGAPALRIVTFDTRMAQAARGLGWSVAGA